MRIFADAPARARLAGTISVLWVIAGLAAVPAAASVLLAPVRIAGINL